MYRVFLISFLISLLATGNALALSAQPAPVDDTPVITDEQTFADKISLEQAVRQVRRQHGGRILSAETRGSGSKRVHVIKVLTDEGRVQTVRIRAN